MLNLNLEIKTNVKRGFCFLTFKTLTKMLFLVLTVCKVPNLIMTSSPQKPTVWWRSSHKKL